jgi:alpha-glucosidase
MRYFFLILCLIPFRLSAQLYTLSSPDQRLIISIQVEEEVSFGVDYDYNPVLYPSAISMTLGDGKILGKGKMKVKKAATRSVNEVVNSVVPTKSRQIRDNYEELTLTFKAGYQLVFRAYNEGAAYHFVTDLEDKIIVKAEELSFRFAKPGKTWFPEEKGFFTHQEREYIHTDLDSITSDRFCSLPVLVQATDEIKVAITESDLQDYPGFFLQGNGEDMLHAIFPHFVTKTKQLSDRDVLPNERADYLAETSGKRAFPWRIMALASDDAQLIANQMVFLLAPPLRIDNPDWIQPGKVAWDWYNFNNIFGVDFRAGVNTETYKYYIDFASQYGIEYIILDEGWYELGDLLKQTPDMDVAEIIRYGKSKQVEVIPWVVWKTLEDQWDEAFDQFEKWGVAGLKVDFMQRDDQWMVNYYWRVAEECAKRKLFVDFHGSYKPSGIRRAYPNVLTREGVRGLEQNKWSEYANPRMAVTIPFIRMLAGPLDYTPGAMLNATKENFVDVFNKPMSMGTRCHQLAMYVVYESPLQMLAESPSHYLKEAECMEFLSAVPTVWDTTIVLQGEVGEYVAIARRSGDDWYVGAMTNWDAREMEVDFSFLPKGKSYQASIYEDGINADRYAADYKMSRQELASGQRMRIRLAPGGGWAARIQSVD